MRCDSVACSTPSRMTQSITRSFLAAHMMLWNRVYNEAGNVISTHEHKGDFKEP